MNSKYVFGLAAIAAIALLILLLPKKPAEEPVVAQPQVEAPPPVQKPPAIPASLPMPAAATPPQEPGPVSGVPVPHMVEPEVTPEPPPEQTIEWQIAQKQAMLKALQTHIESREARLRSATSESDRAMLESQIRALQDEQIRQQSELDRLQQQGP